MAAGEKAFDLSKELLTSFPLLVHFDPSLPLIMACDTSEYGVGAMLAHRMPDGEERPIGYGTKLPPVGKRGTCLHIRCQKVSLVFIHTSLLPDHRPQALVDTSQ